MDIRRCRLMSLVITCCCRSPKKPDVIPKLALINSERQPVVLLADVRQLILDAREGVARAVNTGLVILYWQKIGRRIRKEILHEKRAEYGEKILHALSAKLAEEFGRGFAQRNLFSMVRFAEAFPDASAYAVQFYHTEAVRSA